MSIANQIRQSFKEDMWYVDILTTLIFAAGLSAIFGYLSDDVGSHPERILNSVGFALAIYFVASLLGFLISKRIQPIRSWIWMPVAGAFIYTVGITLTAIPIWLEYYRRFPGTSGLSPEEQAYRQFVPGGLLYVLVWFLIWAISGACCVIIGRGIVAFLDQQRYK